MKTGFAFILELLRIAILFIVIGGVLWALIENVYDNSSTTAWVTSLAVLIIFFVLYRNILQFSGWYKGKGRNKLSKSVTLSLIGASIILLLAPLALEAL
ncbi:hypothetical protein E3U55_06395 [Filobacillus milosensis]|uniref:Uncharacterized protein n=1 Tax=Filobacillus milosensis TaxID=94137 RepID=A0A4Y8IQW8_9BACI|nr:hypothetical protein [Filobacillus milosensis]TFB22864.1 hypothetical protein E3U55_06395 [Filobacillus milosensis]